MKKKIKIFLSVLTILLCVNISLYANENDYNKSIQPDSVFHLDLEKNFDAFENRTIIYQKRNNDLTNENYKIEFYNNVSLTSINMQSTNLGGLLFDDKIYSYNLINTKEFTEFYESTKNNSDFAFVKTDNIFYYTDKENIIKKIYVYFDNINMYVVFSAKENESINKDVSKTIKRITKTTDAAFNASKYNILDIKDVGKIEILNIVAITTTAISFNYTYSDTVAQMSIYYGENIDNTKFDGSTIKEEKGLTKLGKKYIMRYTDGNPHFDFIINDKLVHTHGGKLITEHLLKNVIQ